MKRGCVVTVVALGLCADVFGMNYMGPPTTRMRLGQWYIGVSYADGQQDAEFDDSLIVRTEVEDIETHLVLGRVGVGLATDRLEIFGLAGSAEVDHLKLVGLAGSAEAEWEATNSDAELAMGAGFRATMYLDKENNLDWGIVGQFVYFNGEEDLYELSMVDAQLGIGPCWRPGPWMLYGGVLIHLIDGEFEAASIGDDTYRIEDVTADFRQESWLGIYFGGGVDLAEHLTLTAETQATPDSFGWGVGAQLRF